jgi:hypothetical protein
MAIINVSFDTKTKECELSMDGQIMPNVRFVCVDKYDDENSLRIEFREETADGMTIYTTARASAEVEKVEPKEVLEKGLKTFFE